MFALQSIKLQGVLCLVSFMLRATASPMPDQVASLEGIGPENAVVLDLDKTYTLAEIQSLAVQQSAAMTPEDVFAPQSGAFTPKTAIHSAGDAEDLAEVVKRQVLTVGYNLYRNFDFTCEKYLHRTRKVGVQSVFNFGNGHLASTPLLNVESITDESFDHINGAFSARLHHHWCVAFGNVVCKYDLTASLMGHVNYGNYQVYTELYREVKSDTRYPTITESCVNLGHHVNACPKNYYGQFTQAKCTINFITVA